MSPTAQMVMSRPSTASLGDFSMDEIIGYRVQQFRDAVVPREHQAALTEVLESRNPYGVSANLGLSRRAALWRLETGRSEGTGAKWLAQFFDLDTDSNSADYLFEEAVPERVPDAWVAELSRYRSVEDHLVLPWNEPRSDTPGW